MILNLKRKFYDKRWFIIILLIFWAYVIIINNPFNINSGNNNVMYWNTRKGVSYEITSDNPISQKFIADYDEIKSINISVATYARVNTGQIDFEVYDELGNIIGLYSTDMANIADNSTVSIPIENEKNSKGKEYTISIKSLVAKEGNAIVAYKGEPNKGVDVAIQGNTTLDAALCFDVEYYIQSLQALQIVCWILMIISSIIIVTVTDKADEKSFLIIAIYTGIIVLFTNSFTHYLDENTHFFRSFMISQGNFIDQVDSNGNIGGWVSSNYESIVSQQLDIKNFILNHEVWDKPFYSEKAFYTIPYMSSVMPLNHGIAAIGIFLGRLINAPAIITILLGRLCDLIFYICFCYFAIKNCRYYKTLFFTVALTPYSLWLASSYSIDPILISSSLLFLSICLKYYLDDTQNVVSTKDLVFLFISATFIVSVKYLVYTPLLLTFFLIPKKKFKENQWKRVFILAIVLVVVIILMQLKMLKTFNFTEDRNGDVDVTRQMYYIFTNLKTAFRNFANYYVESQLGFIESVGSPNYGSKTIGNLLGLFVVFGAVFEVKKYEFIDKKKRNIFIVLMLFIFAVVYSLITVSLYLGFTPVGKFGVDGVQSRYLIPILIFLMIPISFIPIKNNIENYSEKVAFVLLLGQINMIMGLLISTF